MPPRVSALPSASSAEPGPRSQPGDAEGVEEGSIGKVMGVGARMGATPAGQYSTVRSAPVENRCRVWVSGSMRVVVRITMGQRIYASGR